MERLCLVLGILSPIASKIHSVVVSVAGFEALICPCQNIGIETVVEMWLGALSRVKGLYFGQYPFTVRNLFEERHVFRLKPCKIMEDSNTKPFAHFVNFFFQAWCNFGMSSHRCF